MTRSICHTCNGTGRVSERGRLYTDPGTRTSCPDCWDQHKAQQENEESLAMTHADNQEADNLMYGIIPQGVAITKHLGSY